MNPTTSKKRVAFLTANKGVEKSELTGPWDAIQEAGYETELLAPTADPVQLVVSDQEPAGEQKVDAAVAQAAAGDYDLLVLPGGTINADTLRMNSDAINFVREFVQTGRTIGAICHGPWALVESGDIKGKTATSYPSLRTDITNAGGTWQDEAPTVCPMNGWELITARNPDDVPVFSQALVNALNQD